MKTEDKSYSDTCHIFGQLMRSQLQVDKVYEPVTVYQTVTGDKEKAAVEAESKNRQAPSTAQQQ